jgi:hypothetical protein
VTHFSSFYSGAVHPEGNSLARGQYFHSAPAGINVWRAVSGEVDPSKNKLAKAAERKEFIKLYIKRPPDR